MGAVDRVTVHHEGAGTPRNAWQCLDRSYSGAVGPGEYRLVRSPHESFVTAGQGRHRSLQVCFTGNRDTHPLSDAEIVLFRALVDDARTRGWVTDTPELWLHRDTAATVCPGQHVVARRAELEAAVVARPVVSLPDGWDDEMTEETMVLPARWPPAKLRWLPYPFFTHNRDHVLAYNGAAVGGDRAAFGIRVLRVPVRDGHRIVGLSYGRMPDGTDNPRQLVVYASDGGTFVYDVT